MSDDLSGGAFDLERIRSLVELMIEHELGEIDLRNAEHRIRLRRGAMATAPMIAATPAAATPASTPTVDTTEDDGFVYVNSPMIGTFYSKPKPDAQPYVKVGDYVDKETTVCIVEAMKVMNEIQAEVSGRIVAMLVEDEEPVDVGKPLFKIETTA